jgi:NAD(P)-dependent dehydrogenase (short-subunit alcohol dehydrogenase family)
VLVNNLGIAPARDGFLEVGDEDWRRTLDVKLLSMIRACRAAIPTITFDGVTGALAAALRSRPRTAAPANAKPDAR